jgi:hypothetical protein
MLSVKLGINLLYATLSERESVASPVYSMELTPIESKSNKKTLVPTDQSVAGQRVNKIEITITDDPNAEDLPNGIVHLIGGDYIYKIADQNITLETGQLKYNTELDQSEYTGNPADETVYNG